MEGTSPMDPRELRVSDAEREHVVELLNRAVGHGMLTLDEFSQRTEAAWRAGTRAELNAVLIDLPGLTASAGEVAVPKETLELRQTGSSMRRYGPWTVPRRIELRNRLGSMVLDFSRARPEDATLDADQLTLTMASFTNKVRPREQPGSRHFVVTGSLTTGSLTVTTHRSYRIGPLVLHRPFRITWAR
ncbi:MAG TPA: DUF1707 domain-containing protein [Pseudonocardiaceae bacterium]|nr:DUF1707 domain-containing protein [Pseudonocardiaceae bacterium]